VGKKGGNAKNKKKPPKTPNQNAKKEREKGMEKKTQLSGVTLSIVPILPISNQLDLTSP